MKLQDLDFANPLRSTIYGERFLNDTKGRFEDYSEVNPLYDPQGPIAYVDVPYALLPRERVNVFHSSPSDEALAWASEGDMYRFVWHPDVHREELSVAGTVRTQPTSSTRTLLVENNPRIYVKTDLNKKHFRFIRRLQRSSVEHSIAICADLRQHFEQSPQQVRCAFLPESLGVVIRGGAHEGSGMIVREAIPYPHVTDARVMLPYHSLYADDPFKSGDKPLLVQMVELHGTGNPVDFFVMEVVAPLLETWVLLVSRRGILPELHGQNALAEIDSQFRIRRVVYRDFQGTYSDSTIRTRNGLSIFIKHAVGTEPGTTIRSQYSHVFDGMIGRYLLERLSRTFCRHFGVVYQDVCNAIRAYHHNLPGWEHADFPGTMYRFGMRAHEQDGNDVILADSGEPPIFR